MIDPGNLAQLLHDRANGDRVLAHIGRYCSAQILLATSSAALHIDIDTGHVASVAQGPFRMRAWQFALRADDSAWLAFWQPLPRPGFQDIFAMSRFGHLTIDGDVQPLLRDLRFYKRLLSLPRGAFASEAAA